MVFASPSATKSIRGLYAVTPDEPDTAQLLVLAGAALAGGATVLQYRNKRASPALRSTQAKALQALCQAFSVPLIINDHLDLALEVNAGLHIGAEDGDLAQVRAALGPGRLLGVSCYNQIALAQSAAQASADYIAFGSVFASPTKPKAVTAPLRLFAEAKAAGITLPLVGIGGITLANLPQLVQAGADAAAVISELFQAKDIQQRAQQLASCFNTKRS